MRSPFSAYVGVHSAKMHVEPDGAAKVVRHLLWGDGIRNGNLGVRNGFRHVKARGAAGWVDESMLGGEPLLEVYFIDVGQGDGVLVRTPDFRHLLIDGGYPRASQPSVKSAADFVDWKFAKDFRA